MPRASYSPSAACLTLAVLIDMVEQMAATPDLAAREVAAVWPAFVAP